MPGHITRDELWAKVERGDDFILLETLAPETYAYGHLPGALNLPPGEVKRRAHELIPNRDTEVVVYCGNRGCHASTDAANELASLGYTRVLDYLDGKADWKEAGLPMEASAGPPGEGHRETPGSGA
jgi:rhodanese-related sulfurtransferase